jgi:nucleoside-diphosphate-sugar epimerase
MTGAMIDATPRKKVLITGGTGFIGRPLVGELVSAGHDVWS